MWKCIEDHFLEKYGIYRTPEALRCKWKDISREFQHWIYERDLFATRLPIGSQLDEVGDQLM